MKSDSTVYLAHSKTLYGSFLEKQCLKVLNKRYKRVVNPQTELGDLHSTVPYLTVVSLCDEVIVLLKDDFIIGKGTYDEVMFARRHHIPVHVVMSTSSPPWFLFPMKRVTMIGDGYDWVLYARVTID